MQFQQGEFLPADRSHTPTAGGWIFPSAFQYLLLTSVEQFFCQSFPSAFCALPSFVNGEKVSFVLKFGLAPSAEVFHMSLFNVM